MQGGVEIMKAGSLRLALTTALFAVALPLTAYADAGETSSVSGFQGKVSFCNDCHGAEGRGYLGWFPMPRIAGQQTQYFVDQLKDFEEKNRENNIAILMYEVHKVRPSLAKALAEHFHHHNPAPLGGAPRELVSRGKKIFDEGVSEASVPACAACHGQDGHGSEDYPRLAGQVYQYTVKELINWSKERGQKKQDPGEATMGPLAHNLSKEQVKAVAAYLSTLR